MQGKRYRIFVFDPRPMSFVAVDEVFADSRKQARRVARAAGIEAITAVRWPATGGGLHWVKANTNSSEIQPRFKHLRVKKAAV